MFSIFSTVSISNYSFQHRCLLLPIAIAIVASVISCPGLACPDLFCSVRSMFIQVDLILHPLKSELNFPIGDKFDLDGAEEGERWTLPIHLFDAIFFVQSGSVSTFEQKVRNRNLNLNLHTNTNTNTNTKHVTKLNWMNCKISGS